MRKVFQFYKDGEPMGGQGIERYTEAEVDEAAAHAAEQLGFELVEIPDDGRPLLYPTVGGIGSGLGVEMRAEPEATLPVESPISPEAELPVESPIKPDKEVPPHAD